ncbi:MAG: methylisocitrate lyase [Fuerstiella sp.]|nr:methylisocitrate lyase [Fuerstiella sp.]
MSGPGTRLRAAVAEESPLQCVGVINACHALLAESSGFQALYLSGGGVAAGSCGIPDLGITTMEDVLIDLRRITDVTTLPVLVDIDTGWGGAFNIARTVRMMDRTGAAGVHIEDQEQQKRCGHRPNKVVVPQNEMVDRIKAAADARLNDDFVIMARIDAYTEQGIDSAIARAAACVAAGADMIFPEAVESLNEYQKFTSAFDVPVLANITEFGRTPLFTVEQLASVGVRIALYPLSAFRAANAAAQNVYQAIRTQGTQSAMVDKMQTREELYELLGYHNYERKLDDLFAGGGPKRSV